MRRERRKKTIGEKIAAIFGYVKAETFKELILEEKKRSLIAETKAQALQEELDTIKSLDNDIEAIKAENVRLRKFSNLKIQECKKKDEAIEMYAKDNKVLQKKLNDAKLIMSKMNAGGAR